ncbi:cytochrome (ubi)quinol oxidase subunit III [Novosphingobium rosa]|uniref:cytochrome (ubi)quinol oxidase subunit III n=1 Tax=Novosphingobium rosa TaxID=76978 RepID=UPI0008361B43|nr:cytochrome (ubi)quinol oxidase subunit III [Novosphingobium rosa]
MSSAAGTSSDPHRLGHGRNEDDNQRDTTGHGQGGPASKRIVVGYGFWIYLLSDIVLFSAFFAAYAVLAHATAGGPSGPQIFTRTRVAVETVCLLLSSYCCGLASLGAERRSQLTTQLSLAATGLLGAAFLAIELSEFAELMARGATPTRSAFLSSFFALVGLHGLHVTIGLLWLGTMMAQTWVKGFRPAIMRRLLCFSLFWHALDIVWVGVFSIVYLLGSRA